MEGFLCKWARVSAPMHHDVQQNYVNVCVYYGALCCRSTEAHRQLSNCIPDPWQATVEGD
eukprot:7482040-Alexandrium_andersonii.AAC.1